MTDLWPDLLACLDLRALPGGGFEGRNQHLEYHRLFGGQLLAQFVRAASLTCPAKAVKSVHVLFPRAGRREEPVRYEVERHHEGSAFATLAITARQAPGVIATAAVSMHVREEGLCQQAVSPVPSVPGAEHQVRLDLIPWDTRATADLDARDRGAPELDLWMRTPPADPGLAPALTAYATDLTLIGTALRSVDGVSSGTRARPSPPPSPRTPCGSTGRSARTAGCCSASTARCWPTAAATAAVTSSPRTAPWWPPTRRRPWSASLARREPR